MSLPSYAMQQANFAQMYERELVGPLFRPWVEELLERTSPATGDRVLDLACGTGIVARVAKEKLDGAIEVVGADISPQMLEVANGIDPRIQWVQADATGLPASFEASFDVVLCQQGLQFFADKQEAVRGMRRVLKPEGRVAVAVWRAIADSPCFLALQRVAERHLDDVVDHRFGYGDADALRRLFDQAGFTAVRVESVSRVVRLPDAASFARMNAMALVGMSPGAGGLDASARAQLLERMLADTADALAPFADGAQLAFPMATNVASARR